MRSYICRISSEIRHFARLIWSPMQTAPRSHATLSPHQLLGILRRMQVASNIGFRCPDCNQVSHLIVEGRQIRSNLAVVVVLSRWPWVTDKMRRISGLPLWHRGAYWRRVFALNLASVDRGHYIIVGMSRGQTGIHKFGGRRL